MSKYDYKKFKGAVRSGEFRSNQDEMERRFLEAENPTNLPQELVDLFGAIHLPHQTLCKQSKDAELDHDKEGEFNA